MLTGLLSDEPYNFYIICRTSRMCRSESFELNRNRSNIVGHSIFNEALYVYMGSLTITQMSKQFDVLSNSLNIQFNPIMFEHNMNGRGTVSDWFCIRDRYPYIKNMVDDRIFSSSVQLSSVHCRDHQRAATDTFAVRTHTHHTSTDHKLIRPTTADTYTGRVMWQCASCTHF